jgi:hypothetical protein
MVSAAPANKPFDEGASLMADAIAPDTPVHRVGGGNSLNLRLSAADLSETPPGISVLLGGTPQQAAAQMRQAFPRSRKWQTASRTVGTATLAAVRQAGFDVFPDPTARFPNHGRLIHPNGAAGFDDANLSLLSQAFHDTTGC